MTLELSESAERLLICIEMAVGQCFNDEYGLRNNAWTTEEHPDKGGFTSTFEIEPLDPRIPGSFAARLSIRPIDSVND